MKRNLIFTAVCAALIAAMWALMVVFFTDTEVRRALAITAVVAFTVQLVAFLIAREMARRKNVIAGWGIGIALRFTALVILALVAVPKLNLPLSASLLSLATFLFVSTLIEPLFLKT